MLLGGVGFDNGLLHYTHALEHPLSAIKPDLSHGLGLAMLLPSVINCIYKDKAATLADILEPIVPNLKGESDEAEKAAKGVQKWLFDIGIKEKLEDLGFKNDDVQKLAKLAPSLGMLLGLAPNEATETHVCRIYETSMKAI